MCHEHGCENIIDPVTMMYGKDYFVLINLSEADPGLSAEEILEEGLVGIFCKNCGIVNLAEAQANGYEVVSRREP